jgi:hypothetical protein
VKEIADYKRYQCPADGFGRAGGKTAAVQQQAKVALEAPNTSIAPKIIG